MDIRLQRNTLQLSQSKLARLSRVSRYKICLYELGDGSLTIEELGRISKALVDEVQRLRNVPLLYEFEAHDAAPRMEAE